jgi:hypothetical protein
MAADNDHTRSLDTATAPETDSERQALESSQFAYCHAVGELIWAIITCRPELAFPVTKLSQYANDPALIHYTAVKCIFKYFNATPDDGLTYWHTKPHPSLPHLPPPVCLTAPSDQSLFHDVSDSAESYTPTALHGYVNSDWAMDIRHCRSISGIVFKLAGAAIAWKCPVQPTVSLSSTEAEFLAASDADKMALYLRSILDELHVPQTYATVIYEDNRGALRMASAAQPTKQSRHIDIREYAILDWVAISLLSKMSPLASTHPTPSPNKLVASSSHVMSTISPVGSLLHKSILLPKFISFSSIPTVVGTFSLALSYAVFTAQFFKREGVSVCLSLCLCILDIILYLVTLFPLFLSVE